MFDYNNWILCDYIEEPVEEDNQYLNIKYNEEDINIIIPEYIINTSEKKILKYDYEPYIIDLFNSFSSYTDIINQSCVDLIRSTIYINNRRINASTGHNRIINKMDLYSYSQKDKYSILMISSQAVLGIPYHYICSLYPKYHVGELNYKDPSKDHKVIIRFYLNKDSKKIKIIKKLRVFEIDKHCNDITHQVIQLKLLFDIDNKTINLLIRNI